MVFFVYWPSGNNNGFISKPAKTVKFFFTSAKSIALERVIYFIVTIHKEPPGMVINDNDFRMLHAHIRTHCLMNAERQEGDNYQSNNNTVQNPMSANTKNRKAKGEKFF